ncbi:tetratricopeptide repeat protein [Jiella marina]|uniref:tetratricopeptide repeat protein n=1 Tax=Jiella sp. LLJ827 TaxID=2917712 RepID=UPI00210073AE|nr:tetratricopeptide repeat protein [Jiella sp. LLJ827]MCQ0987380.1 hypothetical protein [Jiella sp. LLJ827]
MSRAHRISRIFVTLAFCLAIAPASAAPRQFGSFVVDSDQPDVIRLQGEIGALERFNFVDATEAAPDARTILLDSPGGSLIIALGIAEDMRRAGFSTVVPEDARCYSACSFLFFAGKDREARGKLGVHQVASTESRDFGFAQAVLSRAVRFLQKTDTAPDVLAIMLATPSNAMHVFSEEELERLAINRLGPGTEIVPPGTVPRVALARPTNPVVSPPPALAPASTLDGASLLAVRSCDELAAYPQDPAKPAGIVGVAWNDLDPAQAVEECEKALAAKPEDARVQFQFARALDKAKRWDEAFQWYNKAAEQDHAAAFNNLGTLYRDGDGVAQDYTKALEAFEKAAALGDVNAQNQMGRFYQFGWGVDTNDREAAKWYLFAAKNGNATAQYNVAWMYANGRGVEQDYETALTWYRKAAEQNDSDALNEIGRFFANGWGVKKDQSEAVRWYRLAADNGSVHAQNNLGWAYANGEGVRKDQRAALDWYRKAADQGHANAQNELGRHYRNGWGVKADDRTAAEWYRKAAENGNVHGQYNLGWLYACGCGVTKNIDEAARWYRKAAEQGHEDARKELRRLGRS